MRRKGRNRGEQGKKDRNLETGEKEEEKGGNKRC